jgi:hypothetical protein
MAKKDSPATRTLIAVELERERQNVVRRLNVAYAALREIAERPTVERNPDGVDQAAATMQLIAREAIHRISELDGAPADSSRPG